MESPEAVPAVRRMVLMLSVIAVAGVMLAIANTVLFLTLEQPLSRPQINATSGVVQQQVSAGLRSAGRQHRATICRRSFNLTRGCSIERMVTALNSRSVGSYQRISEYLRDAFLIALVRREQALIGSPYSSDRITAPVTRLLVYSTMMAQEAVQLSAVRSSVPGWVDRCRQRRIPPGTCLTRIVEGFEQAHERWDDPVRIGGGCMPAVIYRELNRTVPADRTRNAAVNAIGRIGLRAGVIRNTTAPTGTCPRLGRFSPSLDVLVETSQILHHMAEVVAETMDMAKRQTGTLDSIVRRKIG